MSSTKEIQHRIRSVSNTKKITSAMEMVAATKMKRATDSVLATRTYANLSWETVLNLSQVESAASLHPLLTKREKVKRVAMILITSNRGLCGGYNNKVIQKAHKSVLYHPYNKDREPVETDFFLLGKKGRAVYKYYGYKIAAEFEKPDLVSKVGEVMPVANMVIEDFVSGKYDKVMVAYTDYVSSSVQTPRVKQILPVDIEAQDESLGIMGQDSRVGTDKDFVEKKMEKHSTAKGFSYDYIFEPSPREVLDEMVPRLIEVQLFQALLESNASEHSARMNAMHQATEAAGEIVDDLTLYYNKARQSAITSEISEISAGANALSDQ